MKSTILFLGIVAVVSLTFAADAPTPAVTPALTKPAKQPEIKTAEMPVSVSGSDKGKGILLFLPQALSASHRNTEIEFDYSIANTLEEALFVETQPVDSLSIDYSDDSGSREGGGGSFSMGPHGRKFALLSGSDYRTGERLISCCSTVGRKARVKLPEFAKAGATFSVTIYVRGYFLKNGQPFSGKVEAPIKLSE
jgi:hypothetical protein